jgi:hypothetical protein
LAVVKPTTAIIPRGGISVTKKLGEVAPKRINMSASDIVSPAVMQRTFNDMYAAIADGDKASNSLPFLSGVWLQGLKFSAGSPLTINHSLSRAYQGYFATRILGSAFTPVEQALASTQSPTRYLILTNPGNATVDLYVF